MKPILATSNGLAVAALTVALALSVGAVRADDANNAAPASAPTIHLPGALTPTSPVDEFSKELEDFQKSVPELNKKIQDSAGAIDGMTDVDQAKAQIDQLRDEVSGLLGAVADNGPVSQLGAKALDHVHAKLKELSQDTRFKPEERQFLIDQWQKIDAQTESATKDLDDARAQFVGLLQTLQSNEDFIGELIEIRQAQKALDVIRTLSQNIRDASSQLNRLIGSIKPPGV